MGSKCLERCDREHHVRDDDAVQVATVRGDGRGQAHLALHTVVGVHPDHAASAALILDSAAAAAAATSCCLRLRQVVACVLLSCAT